MAPNITVNQRIISQMKAAGDSTNNFGPTGDDLQCQTCENEQGPYSLIQRREMARTSHPKVSGNPASFEGQNFSSMSDELIEAITDEKIQSVLDDILDRFFLSGVINPGDDLHTIASSDNATMQFLDNIRIEVKRLVTTSVPV